MANLEQNQDGLITKVSIEGELPTDVSTYAYKCFLYKKEGSVYFLYINQTSSTTSVPDWHNEGVYEYKEEIIQDSSISKSNISYTKKEITVATGSSTGESEVDETLIEGEILGYYPTGNQDRTVIKVEITVELKVKITLSDNAIADNTFNVVILKS